MNSLKIDTGIDWLGEVPQKWARCRLKTTVRESFNGVWGDEPKDNENDLICIRVADFNYNKLTINLNKYTVRNIPENQHNRMLKKGDILIEKSGGGEKQPVGRAIIYDNEIGKAVCSNFIGKITLYKSKVIPKFVAYYLSSLYSKGINTKHIKQTTGIQNLDLESYLNESIYLPLLTEQQKIAHFLDRKCARIDALIEKKQKLVELKKEERTALINQAVTKGLDTNFPMKDSGIEWLGEIPEHWKVKRLKYVSEINIKSLGENTAPDYEFKYVEISSVGTGELIEEPKCMSFENAPTRARRIVHMGDTIISTVRTYLKAISYIEGDSENLIVSTGFAVVTLIEAVLLPKYLFYILLSEKFIDTVCSLSKGVSYPAINSFELAEISIWYPSLDEQQLILNHIESAFVNYNQFIKNLERQIELLKEYKTTLISEAVTGKIIPA